MKQGVSVDSIGTIAMHFQQTNSSSYKRAVLTLQLLCIGILAVMSTGCTPLAISRQSEGIEAEATTSAGQYQLKMVAPFGKSKTYIGDIDGPLTIQTALERSGATKTLRNMDVELFRNVDGVYAPLKMPAIFDASKRMVRPETDYGLRAGDSILVRPRTENSLRKVLGKLTPQ